MPGMPVQGDTLAPFLCFSHAAIQERSIYEMSENYIFYTTRYYRLYDNFYQTDDGGRYYLF
jgi:hypothetical protein